MKLDISCMQYMSKEEFRVLTAVEMGMRNHELVPVELIASIAKLRHGGSNRILSTLLRYKLIAHDQAKYNGYRLTYQGYDVLALRALFSRGKLTGVGNQIGVGKESDIYVAKDAEGNDVVLKFHRLGRTSFRSVKSKRDYLKHRQTSNWLYLSRLSAIKEYAFMRALYANDFPTPVPLDQNRHVVLMSRVPGAMPMAQLRSGSIENPKEVFLECVRLCVKLAEHGLVHCDFNEFNLMLNPETNQVTMIDFPQMISTMHPNAQELFDRDIHCLVKFFAMKQRYIPEDSEIPSFQDIVVVAGRLDEDLQASGFTREDGQELQRYYESKRGGESGESGEGSDDDEDDSEEGPGEEAAKAVGGAGDNEGEDNDSEKEDCGDESAEESDKQKDGARAARRRSAKRLDDRTIIRRFRARMEAGLADGAAGEASGGSDAEEDEGGSEAESTYTQSVLPATSTAAVRSKVQRTVRKKSHQSTSRNTTKKRDKKGRIIRNTKIIVDVY